MKDWRKKERKMKKIEIYEFDERDLELLKMPLPISPCITKCHGGIVSCCGCQEVFKYEKDIKKYKERNIFDIAQKIQKVRDNIEKVKELKKEITVLEKETEEIQKK